MDIKSKLESLKEDYSKVVSNLEETNRLLVVLNTKRVELEGSIKTLNELLGEDNETDSKS